MKNEKTGKRISSMAGRMLANSRTVPGDCRIMAMPPDVALGVQEFLSCLRIVGLTARDLGSVDELQGALASALTQAPDRKKK
jgi:hypothetical protein